MVNWKWDERWVENFLLLFLVIGFMIAVLLFNPDNIKDITYIIDKIINNDKLRDQLIKKGLDQVKKFSWNKSAKEILKYILE